MAGIEDRQQEQLQALIGDPTSSPINWEEIQHARELRESRVTFIKNGRSYLAIHAFSDDLRTREDEDAQPPESLSSLSDADLETHALQMIPSVVDRIRQPQLLANPNSDEEREHNWRETNAVYRLMDSVFDLTPQDASDLLFIDLLRQRVIPDMTSMRQSNSRHAAVSFIESGMKHSKRFPELLSKHEPVAREMIDTTIAAYNNMQDTHSAVDTQGKQYLVEFLIAVESRGCTVDKSYYPQLLLLIQNEFKSLADVRLSAGPFVLSAELARLAKVMTTSQIYSRDVSLAGEIMKNLSNPKGEVSDYDSLKEPIARYYSELLYWLIQYPPKDDRAALVYPEVLRHMNDQFITPQVIAYFWQAPIPLIASDIKLATFDRYFPQMVTIKNDLEETEEPVYSLRRDVSYYPIIASPNTPDSIKRAIATLVNKVASQPKLPAFDRKKIMGEVSCINKIYPQYPDDVI